MNRQNFQPTLLIILLSITLWNCERDKFDVDLLYQFGNNEKSLPYVIPKSVDLDLVDSIGVPLILPEKHTSQALASFFMLGNTNKKLFFLLDKESENAKNYSRLYLDSDLDRDFSNNAAVPLTKASFIAARNQHYIEFDSVTLPYYFQSPKRKSRQEQFGKLYFWQPVRGIPTTAHFLRNSWRQGNFEFNDKDLTVILIDDDCNGLFDTQDNWAIFESTTLNFSDTHFNQFHETTRLAWYENTAFEVIKIDGSGHAITLKRKETDYTREEDLNRNNPYLDEPQRPRAAREIQWMTSLKSALRKARRTRKPILIEFSTKWSGPCITMNERTYRDAEIVSLSDSFVCLRLDGDTEKELVKSYNITRFPTTVILDRRGKELSRAIGYQPATEFSSYIAQFAKK
ncbi:MAG: thioredoxin [Calditrichaeota bacterium]|nr:MAG: thioredoxin [Calditrichota bacterium]